MLQFADKAHLCLFCEYIKLNESKSIHINDSSRRREDIPASINNQIVPYATQPYLGMSLDTLSSDRWSMRTRKREDLGIEYKN